MASTSLRLVAPTRITTIGAMTTVFTPPASCFENRAITLDSQTNVPLGTIIQPGLTCSTTQVIQDISCIFTAPVRSSCSSTLTGVQALDTRCFPAEMSSHLIGGEGLAVLSPAIDCPVGYSRACTSSRPVGDTTSYQTLTLSNALSLPVQNLLSEGETLFGCCMTGYKCDTIGPNRCVLWPSTAGQILAGTIQGSSCGVTPFTATMASVSPYPPVYAEHTRVNIIHRDMVIPSQTARTTNPLNTAHGLPVSQKAAIGTTVPIIILVLSGLILLYFRRRRQRILRGRDNEGKDSNNSSAHIAATSGTDGKPELDARDTIRAELPQGEDHVTYLDGSTVIELQGQVPTELEVPTATEIGGTSRSQLPSESAEISEMAVADN